MLGCGDQVGGYSMFVVNNNVESMCVNVLQERRVTVCTGSVGSIGEHGRQ
jgi:hypothetical protein